MPAPGLGNFASPKILSSLSLESIGYVLSTYQAQGHGMSIGMHCSAIHFADRMVRQYPMLGRPEFNVLLVKNRT